MISIKTKYLQALLATVNPKDIRDCLHGVHFGASKGRVCGVATDGHMMLVIDAGGTPEGFSPFTVGYDQLKQFLTGVRKNEADILISVTCDGEMVTLQNGRNSTAPKLAGVFPDWERVLPKKRESALPGTFARTLMIKAIKVTGYIDTAMDSVVCIKAHGLYGSTMYVNDPNACLVVMPTRYKNGVSDWLENDDFLPDFL